MQKNINISASPTEEQIEMLMDASKLDIPDDSEYPEFSEEELMEFKKISKMRKSNTGKQTVTLRLNPQALKKAKSLGKGYTSVLSRIIEGTLEDSERLKQYI